MCLLKTHRLQRLTSLSLTSEALAHVLVAPGLWQLQNVDGVWRAAGMTAGATTEEGPIRYLGEQYVFHMKELPDEILSKVTMLRAVPLLTDLADVGLRTDEDLFYAVADEGKAQEMLEAIQLASKA